MSNELQGGNAVGDIDELQETVEALGGKVNRLETGHAVLQENHGELRRRVDDAHVNIDRLANSQIALELKFGHMSGTMATKSDLLEMTNRIGNGFETLQKQYGENYKAAVESIPGKMLAWIAGIGLILTLISAVAAAVVYIHGQHI